MKLKKYNKWNITKEFIEKEYIKKKKSLVIVKPNIILFADGDYWHCNPKFHSEPKTKPQEKNLARDEKANNKLIKEGYVIKRFWEYDLLNNRDQCKEIIKNLLKGD